MCLSASLSPEVFASYNWLRVYAAEDLSQPMKAVVYECLMSGFIREGKSR